MEISNECKIWVRRLFTYLALFLAVIFISRIVFLNFNLLHTDVDSARYMLSALIQSEAAIIAIVVTMSLVAAQLAASLYSVRVINIFRNSPDLWILLLIYGIVLFWGLGVLKLIEKADPSCPSNLICQSNLQGHIALTYSLGIFAFVALAPYIRNTFEMLNASAIMKLLAVNITKDNILESAISEKADKENPNDAILPIIDIVRSALIKYDYETAKDGLRAIRVKIKAIFEKDLDKESEQDVANYLLRHLTRIRKMAIEQGNEYSTNEIIKTIQIIGVAAAEKKLEKIAYGTIMNLGDVGIEAANRKLEWSTQMAITAIETIGTKSDENELRMHAPRRRWWEVSDLEQIGIIAIENRLESAAEHVVASLLGVGIRGADKGQNGIAYNIIKSLEIMERSAENKGLLELTSKISQMRDLVNPISSKNEENSSENN